MHSRNSSSQWSGSQAADVHGKSSDGRTGTDPTCVWDATHGPWGSSLPLGCGSLDLSPPLSGRAPNRLSRRTGFTARGKERLRRPQGLERPPEGRVQRGTGFTTCGKGTAGLRKAPRRARPAQDKLPTVRQGERRASNGSQNDQSSAGQASYRAARRPCTLTAFLFLSSHVEILTSHDAR